MGLFTKTAPEPKTPPVPIKNNGSFVITDKDEPEEVMETAKNAKEEYETYNNEDEISEIKAPVIQQDDEEEDEIDESNKSVKWLRKAIEFGYDEKKIIDLLKKQGYSQDKLDDLMSIYDRMVDEVREGIEEELPQFEEEKSVYEKPKITANSESEVEENEDENKEEPTNEGNPLDTVLSQFDYRLNKIESFLFRGQNEYSNL